MTDRKLIEWGRELRALTRATGQLLTINRRPDVAQIVGADGVHLPELGLPVAEVQQRFPRLSLIGVSKHTRQGLETAALDRASYAFLSPIFEVPDKAAPIGVHGFRTTIANVGIPTYALGGIGPEDLPELLDAGAFGVAVRRAIYSSAAPELALERFVDALDKSPANGE